MIKPLLLASILALASCGSGKDDNSVSSDSRTYHNGTYPQFGDFDPFDWEGITPSRYPIHGIDVAKYQGDIDWYTVRRSGVSFAFIKATEGGDHLDEKFQQNWLNAKRANVLRGAYHFYYFCRTAAEQARWFIDNAPRDRTSLPPVLDIEWNHQSENCPIKPEAATIRREMQIFINKITDHYGKRPLIYTTVDFYHENDVQRVGGAEFWLRSVAGHPSKVYPRQRWAFWQYSGTGSVPGIEGKTDLNVFAGSADSWNQWVGYLQQ